MRGRPRVRAVDEVKVASVYISSKNHKLYTELLKKAREENRPFSDVLWEAVKNGKNLNEIP